MDNKAEVSNFQVQYATDDAKSVPEFECFNYSIILADGVSAGVGSRDIRECGSTENEERLYEPQEMSEYEEFLASSHHLHLLLMVCQNLYCRIAESSVWTEVSYRSIMCLKLIETSGTGRQDEYFELHPTLWPPDFVSFNILGKKFSCLQCL